MGRIIKGGFVAVAGLFFAMNLHAQGNPKVDAKAQKQAAKENTKVKKQRINDLKAEVLNSKAQMRILKHLIRNEGVSKTYPKIDVTFKNSMSERYVLHSVRYKIDGEEVYTHFRDEEEEVLNKGKSTIDNYKGSISPGSHKLEIFVIFQGNDTGIFSYISDYKTRVQGVATFQVEKGTQVNVVVEAYEKGWILTEFKDRPDLKVDLQGAKGTSYERVQ